MEYSERRLCRGCLSDLPGKNLLDLGNQTIADFLAEGEEGRGVAPLALVKCPVCSLLQLRHTVDPDTLYRKFWYRSGINEQMREALSALVKDAMRYVPLRVGDVVCDIGSNDGTLLGFYPPEIHKVGFEPARQLAEESLSKKITNLRMVDDYFSGQLAAESSRGRKYKVITAIAMFYDLENPGEFLRDVASVLHPNGIFVVQMNYLGLMVRNLAFDNICHEHLCYYSLASLAPFFLNAGLTIVDADVNDVNGGSLRVYAKKSGPDVCAEPVVELMMMEERVYLTEAALQNFAERVTVIGVQLREFLGKMKEAGRRVYAYGASTRGSTLLQTVFGGMKATDFLEGVAERDEHKIGRVTAGTGLRIVSEDEARKAADYFLILPYHFFTSILERERRWMQHGGKLILPVPYPRVVAMEEIGGSGSYAPVSLELPTEMAQVMR